MRLLSGKLMAEDPKADDAGRDRPPSLDEFSERLDALRDEPETEAPKGVGPALGRALRISSELLAGLLVGGALGYALDRFLETTPWFLLAGIGFGFAAGLLNLVRAMNKDNEPASGPSSRTE